MSHRHFYYYYNSLGAGVSGLGSLPAARSESEPSGTMLLSAEQLREATNLWGDDSFDTELLRLQTVAVQHIQRTYGVSVTAGTRRDYYPMSARRLRLSEPASAASAEVLAELGGTWTAVSDQMLDPSEKPPHVVLSEERVQAIEAAQDEDVMLPVRVVYMTGADTMGEVAEAAREAVRKMVAHLFYTRANQSGSGEAPATSYAASIGFMTPALYMEVRRLLGPYERNDGMGARLPPEVAEDQRTYYYAS